MFRCLGGSGFHHNPAEGRVSRGSGIRDTCCNDWFCTGGSVGSGRRFVCRLDHGLELSEDHNAVIALLEACTHDLELDLFALLGYLKVWAANVEIARKEDLERSHLRVNANLALEGHGDAERLSGVGHAHIRLELYSVVQSALDKVCASQRIFNNSNATVVNVALGDADALILMTKLSKKASFNIALQVFRVNVNISDESTTFEERITHTVCSY